MQPVFCQHSNERPDEKPLHWASVPGFLLGKTEVTQGQWKAIMGSNPSRFNHCGDDCPVEKVSWVDAQEFARLLSQKTGKEYRLPSKSQWEYAAGSSRAEAEETAWYGSNSEGKTHPVAQKKPNAFGLYDMHGNVWEWAQDCGNADYTGAPSDGSAWTTGDCSSQVIRGDSWVNASPRSTGRNRGAPGGKSAKLIQQRSLYSVCNNHKQKSPALVKRG